MEVAFEKLVNKLYEDSKNEDKEHKAKDEKLVDMALMHEEDKGENKEAKIDET